MSYKGQSLISTTFDGPLASGENTCPHIGIYIVLGAGGWGLMKGAQVDLAWDDRCGDAKHPSLVSTLF
jgi:hypothetical protein